MNILVIGGAGMLGRAITRRFVQHGHSVTSFDLQPSLENGVHSVIGDIRDAAAVSGACAHMDAVIHTVAMVNQLPIVQRDMHEVNVEGTRNVIAACQSNGVPRLLYTSSIDVVFDGSPIANGDESLPYPKRHLDYYGTTKMMAEQDVIAANGVSGVATCSLRAAGLYGEHDRHRFPNVIPRVVKSGQFSIIGDEKAIFNHVYIENMAHAFLLAAERLTLSSPLAGQCYFITDHAPSNFFAFFKPFLAALDIQYTETRLSASTMMIVAQIAETLYRIRRGNAPIVSRYAVAATTRDFWFNHHKAARDFDYAPIVSESEAFERTLAWVRSSLLQTDDTSLSKESAPAGV